MGTIIPIHEPLAQGVTVSSPVWVQFLNDLAVASGLIVPQTAGQAVSTPSAVSSGPPDPVTNLQATISGTVLALSWSAIIDTRTVLYAVFKGTSFSSAVGIGLTAGTTFLVSTSGTYWVVPIADGIQSLTPVSVVATFAPADVTELISYYIGTLTYLSWEPITDFRPITYQILMGPAAGSAVTVGTTTGTSFLVPSNGTFWVVALADGIQSATPAEIIIAGSVITQNILATYSEDPAWSGTLSGAAINNGLGQIQLDLTVGSTGTYTIDPTHIVSVPSARLCQVSCDFTASITNPNLDFDSVLNVDALSDFDTLATTGTNFLGAGQIQIQIALSQDGTTWGVWRNFTPGTYFAKAFNLRVNLISTDSMLTPILSNFSFTVDVPPLVQTFTNQAISASGTSFTFSTPYHNQPNIQITILNPSSGDYIYITGISTTGFTLQILNGGTGVARTCNILSQGY